MNNTTAIPKWRSAFLNSTEGRDLCEETIVLTATVKLILNETENTLQIRHNLH